MQHSPTEIKEKLLKALDREYNVVDMAAVVEVISILERTPITKDALETTRLGKFINELRRKTKNESLAKRAKDLVRRWRDMILPATDQSPAVHSGQHYNGGNNNSAGVIGAVANRVSAVSGHLSPGLPLRGNISPGLPAHGKHLNRSTTVSPAMSLPSSDRSNTSPRPKSRSTTPRPPETAPVSSKPVVSASSTLDPVPKTHASNKRLRKSSPPVDEPPLKKVKRPNGLSTETSAHGIANLIGRSDVSVSAECSQDSFSPHSDHGSNSCEVIESVFPLESVSEGSLEPKKRGRKKGSKNRTKPQDSISDSSRDDNNKAKVTSVGRTHRVKTTQELLADLQARNSGVPSENVIPSLGENKASLTSCLLPGIRGGTREALEMSRNKTEHIAKFLQSQPDLELSNPDILPNRDVSEEIKDSQSVAQDGPSTSDEIVLLSRVSKEARSPGGSNPRVDIPVERPVSLQDSQTVVNKKHPSPHLVGSDRTVEEILARLPPVNESAVEWEQSLSPPASPPARVITEEDVNRLHDEHIEGINGIFNHSDHSSKEGENDFREWHQTVSRLSYQGELLHILPYVVID